jgi:uncharacterized protein (TIGR02453 family)
MKLLMSDDGRFEGFSRNGLLFLEQLAKRNERDFFIARKDRYERELACPMRAFVAEATEMLRRARVPIGGDAKRSIFRIYRDVRFRVDKRPYKTHLAAYLSYDGGRDTPGGLYVHVDPGGSYLSLAFYLLDAPMLQRWRREMAERPARFRSVLRALARGAHRITPPEGWDDALKRMPRGFERQAKSDLAPYFRLRSFCVRCKLTKAEVTSRRALERAVAFVKETKALLDFGWSVM